MTTLVEQHTLANDQNFIIRVQMAMAAVARDVLLEDQGQMSVSQSELRTALARRMLNSPDRTATLCATILATVSPTANPTAIPDASYVSFIADEWDTLAGYNDQMAGGA